MTTAHQHVESSDRFLRQADDEFRAGDLLQASEKAWGAVAHFVKSVAEKQGWRQQSHYDVRKNARRLIKLTDDPEQNHRRYTIAEALHSNFYEDMFDSETVAMNIGDARTLIEAMQKVDLDGHLNGD